MGLDMYAFSLERSEAFASQSDILNYRIPADGKDLPPGNIILGADFELFPELGEVLRRKMIEMMGPNAVFYPDLDAGRLLLDTKYVLPGSTLLYRWRKHPALHGWMNNRWNVLRAGKIRRKFNHRERVPLDERSLDALEHAVKHRQLPITQGPYFDVSRESEQEGDLAFIAKAREVLAAGNFVYYTSWW